MQVALERLIGLNWSATYLNVVAPFGPLPGALFANNDWKSLAEKLVTVGPGNWWGKHSGYAWANDEVSQSMGARALMTCLLNGVRGSDPIGQSSVFGAWNSWHSKAVIELNACGGVAPLFWENVRPELLGIWATANAQAFEDNAALKTLEAYAVAHHAFTQLSMKPSADQCLPVIQMICDRVQYLLNRHGGLAQYHHPITGDIISGRSFEPPCISSRETGDALIILALGNLFFPKRYNDGDVYTKLKSWQLDKNVWHVWIGNDYKMGAGVNASGKIVPACLGVWPVQNSAQTAVGVPVFDGAMRQIERYEYFKML